MDCFSGYVGRYAPSPTGPLHRGSLATALGSYLDARLHGGRWLLRIENTDQNREQPGASNIIISQLNTLGMRSDDVIWYQSHRAVAYQQAFDQLVSQGFAYPCGCTRQEIVGAAYPGTCRQGLTAGKQARAWRLRCEAKLHAFHDRLQGPQQLSSGTSGDFVIKRADGFWAYALAVVVDDAAQKITSVVRGDDLLALTADQLTLQAMLGLSAPNYAHIEVVRDAQGRKLSKSEAAPAVETHQPLAVLCDSAEDLHLGRWACRSFEDFWPEALRRWAIKLSEVQRQHRTATNRIKPR